MGLGAVNLGGGGEKYRLWLKSAYLYYCRAAPKVSDHDSLGREFPVSCSQTAFMLHTVCCMFHLCRFRLCRSQTACMLHTVCPLSCSHTGFVLSFQLEDSRIYAQYGVTSERIIATYVNRWNPYKVSEEKLGCTVTRATCSTVGPLRLRSRLVHI